MSDNTSFGDRMKLYEGQEAGRRFIPLLPIIARLDGKAFHTFCRGLKRPYDERLSKLMVDVTKYLVAGTNALMGYTQSDEITLVWHTTDIKSEVFFDGRIQKMTSILAAMATAYFNRHLEEVLPEKSKAFPLFDCRIWQVPNQVEGANTVLWREQDATRNSIQMSGQAVFSHTSLQGKGCDEIQERLFHEKGINWNDYPPFFKRGTFVQKRRLLKPFSAEEIECLPAKHAARTYPDLLVERWELREVEMPPFGQVSNRVGVIFNGEEPVRLEIPLVQSEPPTSQPPSSPHPPTVPLHHDPFSVSGEVRPPSQTTSTP